MRIRRVCRFMPKPSMSLDLLLCISMRASSCSHSRTSADPRLVSEDEDTLVALLPVLAELMLPELGVDPRRGAYNDSRLVRIGPAPLKESDVSGRVYFPRLGGSCEIGGGGGGGGVVSPLGENVNLAVLSLGPALVCGLREALLFPWDARGDEGREDDGRTVLGETVSSSPGLRERRGDFDFERARCDSL